MSRAAVGSHNGSSTWLRELARTRRSRQFDHGQGQSPRRAHRLRGCARDGEDALPGVGDRLAIRIEGDWYRPGHPRERATNPSGPELHDLALTAGQSPSRVIKGGSFLCASNYCARYHPAARQPQEVDLGATHLGFRTVLNRNDRTTP